MAKRQIRDYVFTPGISGAGTIKILDKISKEQLLLITNTTANEILYSFNDPSKPILVSFTDTTFSPDPDFPYADTLSNGVTTITLGFSTTQYHSTDDIQIFIEGEEIRTRPYDFGTDAIERQRMASPQSMIDADFEYGIQPTKWQTIDLMRGYPSIYEQPGADLAVSSLTTDASNTTNNIGPSIITIGTETAHGFSVGDPITLRGVLDSVPGFSKAEGSFIVSAIVDTRNFQFFAKGRVGTTPATNLFSSSVQLRRAGFYTGSEIGSPTFSVASNGANGQVTARGNHPSGSTLIGVNTGTMPPIGSPVTGTGMAAGAQVSAVVNLSATLAITSTFTAPVSTITLNETNGIAIGSALDNGSGTTIFVTNIDGNDITLSSPYTLNRSGNSFVSAPQPAAPVNFGLGGGAKFDVDRDSGAYTNVRINPSHFYGSLTGAYSGIVGTGATFDVERNGQVGSVAASYVNVNIGNSGSGYSPTETITIPGTSVGGTSPANDIVITILTVSTNGSILTFSFTGTPSTFAANRGSNFSVGEKIVIFGNALGGTSPLNDLSIIITGVNASGGITTFLAVGDAVPSTQQYNFLEGTTTSSGVNASFNVLRTGSGVRVAQVDEITIGGVVETGDVFTVTLNGVAHTYIALAGNTLTAVRNGLISVINGNQSAVFAEVGPSPEVLVLTAVNAGTAFTCTVSTTDDGGAAADGQTIVRVNVVPNQTGNTTPSYSVTVLNGGSGYQPGDTVTILGTELGGDVTNNLTITVGSVNATGSIQTITFSGTASSGNALFLGMPVNPTAFNATFLPKIVSNQYAPTIVNSGFGYLIGYQFKIAGSALGGASPTNDMTITVTNINAAGSITEVTATGNPLSADSLVFFPSIAITTPSTSAVSNNTSLSFLAIAKLLVTFSSNHGLVPGNAILSAITSTGTNHNLASGPFFIDEVPSLNSFIFTVRSTGTIAATPSITGVIYARTDSFYTHRPFDGGVQLGTGGPAHGLQAIRQSKKYIRYQSGKGIMYTTGALFAPSYDLRSVTASGTTIGSVITVVTDEVDHGLQVGAEIALVGLNTSGYNGHYIVASIVDEITFTVLAVYNLGNTVAEFGVQPQVSLYKWKGATVRAGAFDDQNGIFFQYDGTNLAVGLRSSTYQLAGTVSATPNSNTISGTNTRFADQLVVGDRIVIRGMSHVVTKIDSQSLMFVNPDYRGIDPVANIKAALTRETIIPQYQWNIDKGDGTGKSGYDVKVNKMQMIGFQYSWYGAGFIDWMFRGPSGNFIFLHRLKNNNTNTEAFMRSGNLPVRYEVLNEGPKTKLTSPITATSTSLPVENTTLFPSNGVVYVDNELIRYSDKNATSLFGLTRSASLQNFVAGANRTYAAGSAAAHSKNTGVIMISNTATPQVSHWGSAFITDGGFDEDRGYIFNYQANTVSISTTKSTVFLIRLAPSVSNALTGDLGQRELINRAQLLLQGIEVTTQGGSSNQGVVIEGVLNPQNYPVNPADIQWFGLNTAGAGGQPSFAQIARGNTVSWKGSASPITAANAISQGNTQFIVFNRSQVGGVQIGFSVSGSGVPGGTTVVNFFNFDSSRLYIQFSQSVNPGSAGSTTYTFSPQVAALPGEQVFSFVASPGQRDELSLTTLKELTNTPIGGRGTFPNGPDVLAINAYLTGGSNVTSTIVLRWGEAQA